MPCAALQPLSKPAADGGDRGAYIKAREQVRMECERKLK